MKNLSAVHELTLSEGWAEVKQLVKERADAAMLQLAALERPKEVSDDTLRGHISALHWVLGIESRVNRALEELSGEKAPAPEPEPIGSPMDPEDEE